MPPTTSPAKHTAAALATYASASNTQLFAATASATTPAWASIATPSWKWLVHECHLPKQSRYRFRLEGTHNGTSHVLQARVVVLLPGARTRAFLRSFQCPLAVLAAIVLAQHAHHLWDLSATGMCLNTLDLYVRKHMPALLLNQALRATVPRSSFRDVSKRVISSSFMSLAV